MQFMLSKFLQAKYMCQYEKNQEICICYLEILMYCSFLVVDRPTGLILPENRHFMLQAGIYSHLIWKKVFFKY